MKITAGPAKVIRARAAKLEIRWKSIDMSSGASPLKIPITVMGYPPTAGLGPLGCETLLQAWVGAMERLASLPQGQP